MSVEIISIDGVFVTYRTLHNDRVVTNLLKRLKGREDFQAALLRFTGEAPEDAQEQAAEPSEDE